MSLCDSTRTGIPEFIRELRSRKVSFPITDSNPLSNPTRRNIEVLMLKFIVKFYSAEYGGTYGRTGQSGLSQ